MPRRPSPRQRPIPVPRQAEVIYLADRRPKQVFPDLVEIFRQSIADAAAEPGALVIVPFGAVTRAERMRERKAGWSSKAIAEVRALDERRGCRKS